MVYHQQVGCSSVQKTADALYVSCVGWVKKIRGIYERQGHVWDRRGPGRLIKLTSNYTVTLSHYCHLF